MKVINYKPEYAKELADIFITAITAIDNHIYTPTQKTVWIGNHSDNFWQDRFSETQPSIALNTDNQAIGFIELLTNTDVTDTQFYKKTAYIDCFYIKPAFQKQGVGQFLYEHALQQAKACQVAKITVDASKLAKPFFIKNGFQVIKENNVILDEQTLKNWTMQLLLL